MKKLLHSYILVTPITEEKTKSGIILTVEAQSKQLVGKVEKVGIEVENVSDGDTVIYDRLNASPITIEGKEYTICEEDDIICIL